MWAIKLVAKLVLSRLPVPYRVWSALGMFRHGHMDTASYAAAVFANHMTNAFPDGLPPDATVLELGVGDSLASALVARACGAKKTYLVDVHAFARTDIELYKALATSLTGMGFDVPDIGAATSLSEFLECCNAEYLTRGLDSLHAIPARSVDFVYSQSVLEHVRRNEFESTMGELRRILKPTGRASHVIDFKDHLSGALNNLRFPATTWERDFFAKSGFYTNRIQCSTMLGMFERSGFGNIEVRKEWRWDALPTCREAFASEFAEVPDADLLISGMKVTMDGSGTSMRRDASASKSRSVIMDGRAMPPSLTREIRPLHCIDGRASATSRSLLLIEERIGSSVLPRNKNDAPHPAAHIAAALVRVSRIRSPARDMPRF